MGSDDKSSEHKKITEAPAPDEYELINKPESRYRNCPICKKKIGPYSHRHRLMNAIKKDLHCKACSARRRSMMRKLQGLPAWSFQENLSHRAKGITDKEFENDE
jgi:hypothetical protein